MTEDILTEADIIAGEAYQIIGDLAFAANLYDHPEVQRALDWFSGFKPGVTYKDDASILPWPMTELVPNTPTAPDALEFERLTRILVPFAYGAFEQHETDTKPFEAGKPNAHAYRAMRAVLSALPRTSGVPEAEAVKRYVPCIDFGRGTVGFPVMQRERTGGYVAYEDYEALRNAAPPPVVAPNDEVVAQAYRAGFKAGKVWAEPAHQTTKAVSRVEALLEGMAKSGIYVLDKDEAVAVLRRALDRAERHEAGVLETLTLQGIVLARRGS